MERVVPVIRLRIVNACRAIGQNRFGVDGWLHDRATFDNFVPGWYYFVARRVAFPRRVGRVDEGGCLENSCAVTGAGGSNPSPSAFLSPTTALKIDLTRSR